MRPRVVKRGVGDFESIDEGTDKLTHMKLLQCRKLLQCSHFK